MVAGQADVLQGPVAERVQVVSGGRAAQPVGDAVGLPVNRGHDTLSGENLMLAGYAAPVCPNVTGSTIALCYRRVTRIWRGAGVCLRTVTQGGPTPSLDHLVGPTKQCRRHGKAKHLCGLEVDDQLHFG
jgi:hypothetical protein